MFDILIVVSNHETWGWGGRGGKFKSLIHKHPRYFNIIVLHSDTLFFAAMEGGGLVRNFNQKGLCNIHIYSIVLKICLLLRHLNFYIMWKF